MHQTIGKYIMITGILLLILGAIVFFTGDKLRWFGHLPGDIRIDRENFKFYMPITSLVLISLLLTLIINLIRKLF